MSFQIAPVFAVPLAQDQHPAPERLNQELKALLLSREHDPAYANPNPSLKQQPGVFESDFTLFSWNEPCIKELKAFVWAALFGWLVFAEPVTLETLAGVVLIVIGCWIAARKAAPAHTEQTTL